MISSEHAKKTGQRNTTHLSLSDELKLTGGLVVEMSKAGTSYTDRALWSPEECQPLKKHKDKQQRGALYQFSLVKTKQKPQSGSLK